MNSDETRSVAQKSFDPEGVAVIPWAEGNGLWQSLAGLTSDLDHVDVATFFVRNPYACDSAESLAVRIGRQATKVAPVLERLREAGFLDVMDLDGVRVYELTREPYHRQTLEQYVTWLREGYHWARMVMDR